MYVYNKEAEANYYASVLGALLFIECIALFEPKQNYIGSKSGCHGNVLCNHTASFT